MLFTHPAEFMSFIIDALDEKYNPKLAPRFETDFFQCRVKRKKFLQERNYLPCYSIAICYALVAIRRLFRNMTRLKNTFCTLLMKLEFLPVHLRSIVVSLMTTMSLDHS